MRKGELSPQEYIADFRSRTGRMPSQVEVTKNLGLSPEKAIRELMQSATQPTFEEKKEATRSEKPFSFLAVAFFGVAIVTSALSVYFTALWFTSMFNFAIAGAISVSMVSYMVLSPQAAGHVRGRVKIPLWGTFVIDLVFSMGSTVAGQYNQLTESTDVVEVNDRALRDSLRQEEADLSEGIQEARRQQRFHQQTLESLSQTPQDRIDNGPYIRTERNMVNELGFELEQMQERLSGVRAGIRAELERGSTGATVDRPDFYSWLAGLFGVNANRVEFAVSSLPAVFIDVIAALSLSLAVGIRRGKS